MPTVMQAAELEAVLFQLLQQNTAQVRQAEATLKTAFKNPAFICDLFQQLQVATNVSVRQMAAVLVRRRIVSQWAKIDETVQTQLQAVLIERLSNETESIVRRSLASVASVIARHALPNGKWPELFAFLNQCASSAAEAHRELAMVLLASLLESEVVVESCLKPHFGHISGVLQAALADTQHPSVPRAALKAVGAWWQSLLEEHDAPLLQPLCAPLARTRRQEKRARAERPVPQGRSLWRDLGTLRSDECRAAHTQAAIRAPRGLRRGGRI